MLLGFYLFLVIALPLALGGLVVYNGLPRGRCCPGCAAETMRLQSRRHAVISQLFHREALHARWCPSCAWSGTARLPRPVPASTSRTRTPPSPVSVAAPDAGLEIRRVEIDGDPWQVRLHCWAEAGTWCGQLLFVGPGGRSWVDDRPCVTGESALQVLSQALAFPDHALVGRIRKASR